MQNKLYKILTSRANAFFTNAKACIAFVWRLTSDNSGARRDREDVIRVNVAATKWQA